MIASPPTAPPQIATPEQIASLSRFPPTGTYGASPSLASCFDCAPGFFQPRRNQTVCVACPGGFYQAEAGRPDCAPCAVNTFLNSTGKTECAACSTESYALMAATECVPCSDIDMSRIPSVSTCTECDGPNPEDCSAAVCAAGVKIYSSSARKSSVLTDFDGFNPDTTRCSAQCSSRGDRPAEVGYRKASQPFCLDKHFLQGTLGRCDAASVALQITNASAVGNGPRWTSLCDHYPVTSCDPAARAPSVCGRWDFLSGAQPSSITVPAAGAVDGGFWQIFEPVALGGVGGCCCVW